MHVKPRKRPTTGHIISVLEREANMTTSQLNPFNPSDSSSSDTSSFSLVPGLHRPFQVMNPSDTYAESSDDTCAYHQSVDSLSTIYNEVDVEEDNKNMFSDIYIEPVDYFLLERRVSSQALPKILDETLYSLGKDMSHSINPEMSLSIYPEMSHSITPEMSHSITPKVSHSITPEVSHAITPEVSHSITSEVKSGESEHKLNTPNYYLDPKGRPSEISMFPSHYMKHRPLPAIPKHTKQSLTAKVPVQNIFSSPKPDLVVAGYDDEETFIKAPFSQNKGNTIQEKVNTTQNIGAYGKEAYIPLALFVTPVDNAIPHKLIPYQRKGYTDLNPITMSHNTAPQYLYKHFRVSSVPALSLPYLSNQDISNINVNTFLLPELCPKHPNDRAPIQQSAEFCGTSRNTQEPLEASRYLSEAELAVLSGCVAVNDVVYV
ncbi:unnamed protein product [Lymnaea stagnalis]|uniref:Uncharacterized protein n=1 Tax=Lymnaea stagnalis TaxID=6523 RepID=A0AAV2HV82_LYMST